MIHLFRPDVGLREMVAVNRVIASRWLGEGPLVTKFTERWAAYLGVSPNNLLPMASASDALFLSMELLDVGLGDEVIIPSIHFVAAANAILRRGATPIFCDVNSWTMLTDANYIKEKITERTRAIMVLHYGGLSCNMIPIQELGYPIIEDAAVAVGTHYKGRACGTIGTMGTWSFDAMKMIGAGSGGMLYCNDDRAKLLSRLGVSQQHGLSSQECDWWSYELEEYGRLSEMNDITAAMALVQLDKLESNLRKRNFIWRYYSDRLFNLVHIPPWTGTPSFYWIQTKRRDELAQFLRKHGIYTSFRYWPLHWAMKIRDRLPGAEQAAGKTLLLPFHSALTKRQMKTVCDRVGEFFGDI